MQKPLLIGITGGIGSGKTTLSNLLREKNYLVYDADSRAKLLQNTDKSLREKITSLFGQDAYNEAGELNRPFLAKIVFNNAEKLQQLNEIVHPVVKADFENWVELNKDKELLFQESAILFESGFYQMFDKIIVVTADKNIRVERVIQRDNITREQALERMSRQLPESELLRRADFICSSDKGLCTEDLNLLLQFIRNEIAQKKLK